MLPGRCAPLRFEGLPTHVVKQIMAPLSLSRGSPHACFVAASLLLIYSMSAKAGNLPDHQGAGREAASSSMSVSQRAGSVNAAQALAVSGLKVARATGKRSKANGCPVCEFLAWVPHAVTACVWVSWEWPFVIYRLFLPPCRVSLGAALSLSRKCLLLRALFATHHEQRAPTAPWLLSPN